MPIATLRMVGQSRLQSVVSLNAHGLSRDPRHMTVAMWWLLQRSVGRSAGGRSTRHPAVWPQAVALGSLLGMRHALRARSSRGGHHPHDRRAQQRERPRGLARGGDWATR